MAEAEVEENTSEERPDCCAPGRDALLWAAVPADPQE